MRKAGGSLTIVLPSAMTKKHGIAAGARLWIAETHEGLLITFDDDEFQKLAKEVVRASSDYGQALSALCATTLTRTFVTEELRVRKAGGSLTIVLPSAMTKKHGIAASARLWISETHKGLLITFDDAEFQGLAKEVARASSDYRQALRALKPD